MDVISSTLNSPPRVLPLLLMVVLYTVCCVHPTSAFEAFLHNIDAVSFSYPIWQLPQTATSESPLIYINESWSTPSASRPPSNGAILIGNASFQPALLEDGWDFFQVEPFATANTSLNPYYIAGYAEGYLTRDRITKVWASQGNYTLTEAAESWLQKHLHYIHYESFMDTNHSSESSAFWGQVANLILQMEGIAHGYSDAAALIGLPVLSTYDIFRLNFVFETSDVEAAVASTVSQVVSSRPPLQRRRGDRSGGLPQHCSALIKVTPTDIFAAHDTWDSYSNTMRMYKVYVMNEATVAMSSMPGFISSGDDWYITSNLLSVMETSLEVFTESSSTIVALEIVPESVSEYLRVMVATYLAADGADWVSYFSYNNSGTYNNQWMVLNYNQYTQGQMGEALQDGLLWVAEQIPGNVTAADVTQVLRDTSYWASFNIPYFPNIFNASGFQDLVEQFGDVFSYTKYARPEIFKRNESSVTDLITMRAIMRYNNWQEDPLSVIPNCPYCAPRGSPWLAIASRGDLVNDSAFVFPKNFSYGSQFMNAADGSIDAKIASYRMFQTSATGNVICGPTSDQQPVFVYDESYPGQRPPGSANVFNFPWVYFNVIATSEPTAAPVSNTDTKKVIVGCAVGIPLAVLVVGFAIWKYKQSRDAVGAEYSHI